MENPDTSAPASHSWSERARRLRSPEGLRLLLAQASLSAERFALVRAAPMEVWDEKRVREISRDPVLLQALVSHPELSAPVALFAHAAIASRVREGSNDGGIPSHLLPSLLLLDARGFAMPGELVAALVRSFLRSGGEVLTFLLEIPGPGMEEELLCQLARRLNDPEMRRRLLHHPAAGPALWREVARVSRRAGGGREAWQERISRESLRVVAEHPGAVRDAVVNEILCGSGDGRVRERALPHAPPERFLQEWREIASRGRESDLRLLGGVLARTSEERRSLLHPEDVRPLLEASDPGTRLVAIASLGQLGETSGEAALEKGAESSRRQPATGKRR